MIPPKKNETYISKFMDNYRSARMNTRQTEGRIMALSKIRKLYAKKRKLRRTFRILRESRYNMFFGQQICAMRAVDMSRYIEEFPIAAQYVYDAGIALVEMKIVKKDDSGKYVLNEEFPDYQDWKQCEDMVRKNCDFLACIGHPSFS